MVETTLGEPLLVVHPIGGFIVWVYGVLVADFCSSGSLLVHVGPTHQLGTKVPAFTARQLHIDSYVIIGVLCERRRKAICQLVT